MPDNDLRNQLDGLFSDIGLEPEAETPRVRLEEALVAYLFGDEAEAELAIAAPMAMEGFPSDLVKPQEVEERREIPRARARFWKVALSEQRVRIIGILLHGASILGAALLVFVLTGLIWQKPMTWSGFYVLYFAAHTVALVVMLIQWVLTSFLRRAFRKAQARRAKAARSQTRPLGQAGALATANALLRKPWSWAVRLRTDSRAILNVTTIVVPAYMSAIAGAEAVGVFFGVVPGAVCHAILIPALLSHYVSMDETPYRRVLPVLALAPLLRLLSLTMPVRQVPQIYWYAMIGIPLLIAVALTARLLDLSWANLGLRLRSRRSQILIALSGLPLSVAAFLLLKPEPITAGFDWRDVAVGSLILMVFSGFTEEIIFRGMLQRVANELFGQAGLLCSSALFAIMHSGSLSLSYVLFIGLVGLFFGWCVNRTRSIWGVILAHSILNIGMILVWPSLWR